MTDTQPRWPRGAPEDEHHHGQGGRWIGALDAAMAGISAATSAVVTAAGTHIWPGFDGATSAAEVGDRAAAYAHTTTGHHTRFDFGDTDPTLAAEWATGILHGMTLFPSSKIDRVDTGRMPVVDPLDGGVEAVAKTSDDGRTITFGTVTDPEQYRRELQASQRARFLAVGNPTGMALHEFAHTIANANPGMYDYAVQQMRGYAEQHRTEMAGLAAQEISRYTWTGGWRETLAEAFAHHAWGQYPPSGLAAGMVAAMQRYAAGER